MASNILELAKKLKALADRGVDGEKDNATTMLHKLMKTHNISFDMIDEPIIKEHCFFMPEDQRKFFIQVASSVLGQKFSTGRFLNKGAKKPGQLRYYINCSDVDFLEIMAKHEFYYREYEKGLGAFYSAFIQTNELYCKPGNKDTEPLELTPDEIEKLKRMRELMAAMDKKQFNKQLSA